ncbi:tRNA (cytosine(38)-C(5))-methyltransferase isoform X2 [Terrapene carolina triunguis]|uniref:tRNA (cytosine(38)-C(5))-methyltransferase isoform X2 n=1 Tax=Terrapene triunguis TaxID=2587831 RepID=UPI000CEF99C1|nr:tRNA (cytosine(38)-C(5))-methyltransferase isoform X2 [Terrapene carolina triunguis]
MGLVRVLELYSGIGGMHQALTESCISAEVVAAVDVNTVANEVYKHNFPSTPLWAKTIEGITLAELNRLSFDMILMSPPCQPFTRIGLQGDVSDPRTNSFLYILDILPRLQRLPKYILLENVKGFETSSARDKLVETLKKCGFKYQEFLLSPTCILENFPDQEPKASVKHRVAAGLKKESSFMPHTEEYIDPNSGSDGGSGQCSQKEAFVFKLETAKEMEKKRNQDSDLSIQMLQDFLEEDGEEMSQYFLPPKALLRYAFLLDIVTPSCRRSTCFTKGYGHYVEGTGSVLQTAEDVQLESVFKSIEMLSEEEKLMKLSTLKLRYFTPREIANLHGFPPEFGFPDKITMKQRYRLLGNSLNVHVVAKLVSLLTG